MLGDRIAIMHRGSLKCSGTPALLKSKFGSGYTFVLTKRAPSTESLLLTQADRPTNSSSSIDTLSTSSAATASSYKCIRDVIRGHVGERVRLSANTNSHFYFTLSGKHSDKFYGLVDELERRKHELGVLNIGVRITTLEDVFMQINAIEDRKQIATASATAAANSNANDRGGGGGGAQPSPASSISNLTQLASAAAANDDEETTSCSSSDKHSALWAGSRAQDLTPLGLVRQQQQMRAIFGKRFRHLVRSWTSLVALVLFVAFFVLAFFAAFYSQLKTIVHRGPVHIDLSAYGDNRLPYQIIAASEQEHSSGDVSNVTLFAEQLALAYLNSSRLGPKTRVCDIQDDAGGACGAHAPTSSSNSSMKSFLLAMGEYYIKCLTKETVVATVFDASYSPRALRLVGFFNNQPYHTPPLALNLIDNALFDLFYNRSGDGGDVNIKVSVHSMSLHLRDVTLAKFEKNANKFLVYLTFSGSFLFAAFSVFLVYERTKGIKLAHFVAGCSKTTYWLANFVWDMTIYMIMVVALFGLLFALLFTVTTIS